MKKTTEQKQALAIVWTKATNTTQRVVNRPKENESITLPPSFATINVGVDTTKNRLFVRASFIGSEHKYYELGISETEYKDWTEIVLSHYGLKSEDDYDNMFGLTKTAESMYADAELDEVDQALKDEEELYG